MSTGQGGEKASDERIVDTPHPEIIQQQYIDGEIDEDEFEQRLETAVTQRTRAREVYDLETDVGETAARDESQSTSDDGDETTSPLEKVALVGGLTLVLVGTIVEGIGFLIGFIFFALFISVITALV